MAFVKIPPEKLNTELYGVFQFILKEGFMQDSWYWTKNTFAHWSIVFFVINPKLKDMKKPAVHILEYSYFPGQTANNLIV